MKKLTKKQIALIPILVACTSLFIYLFVKSAYSPLNFLKQGISLSEPILLKALLVQIYFSLLFAFVVWLAVLSFKDNAPYSFKRRIVLITIAVACAFLLVLCLWFLLDNFANVTLKTLKELQQEYPNHPAIQEIQKAIPINICHYISIVLFYSIFLWLAMPFIRKQDKSNNNPPSVS